MELYNCLGVGLLCQPAPRGHERARVVFIQPVRDAPNGVGGHVHQQAARRPEGSPRVARRHVLRHTGLFREVRDRNHVLMLLDCE